MESLTECSGSPTNAIRRGARVGEVGFPDCAPRQAYHHDPRGKPGPEMALPGAPRMQRGVWQQRFWEHAVCDAAEYTYHMDYVHYNPVKTRPCRSGGAMACFSSFRRWVRAGVYQSERGGAGVVNGAAGEQGRNSYGGTPKSGFRPVIAKAEFPFNLFPIPADRCPLAADTMAHPRFRGANAQPPDRSCRPPDCSCRLPGRGSALQNLFCRVRKPWTVLQNVSCPLQGRGKAFQGL